MPNKFYRKEGDQTIYENYDPNTGQFSGGIGSEADAQKLGVIPDWEAAWSPTGATTNIETITPSPISAPTGGGGGSFMDRIKSSLSGAYQSIGEQVDRGVEATGSTPAPTTPFSFSGDVPTAFPSSVTATTTPTTTPTTADTVQGEFYQIPGQPAVYRWVDGKLIPFSSEREGIDVGLQRGAEGEPYWSNVIDINADQLSQFKGEPERADFVSEVAPEIDSETVVSDVQLSPDAKRAIEEGELVRAEDTPEVYLAEDGTLKHIKNPIEFDKMGYDWADVRDVVPSVLDGWKKGKTITELSQTIDEYAGAFNDIMDQVTSDKTDTLLDEQEDLRGKAKGILEGMASKLTDWWNDPAIKEKEDAITSKQNEVADLQTAKQTALNISKNRMESMGFIKGERGQIKDRMDIEIGLAQAQLGILQGNLEYAFEKAKASAELTLKQEQLKLDALSQALAFNQADLNREDQKTSTMLQFVISQHQTKLAQDQADLDNRTNAYIQITSTYGNIPGLDPTMSVTDQWAVAAPTIQEGVDLKTAIDRAQLADALGGSGSDLPSNRFLTEKELLQYGVSAGTTMYDILGGRYLPTADTTDADLDLINDAFDEETPIGLLIADQNFDLDKVANLASTYGASFNAFKNALTSKHKITIETEDSHNIIGPDFVIGDVIDRRRKNTKLGNINDYVHLFQGGIRQPGQTGTTQQLNQENLEVLIYGQPQQF